MEDLLAGLENAVVALHEAWAGENVVVPAARDLGRHRLVAVTEALGALGRRVDTVRAHVAAEVERRSRRELGADSLAKQQGFRNAAALLAETTGISTGDAHRLTAVGRAVAPRATLDGRPLPAAHPHVAAALSAGTLTAAAAEAIISMLDRVALRSSDDDRDRAERILAAQAPGLSLDGVRTLATRAQAWLDPDGLEPAERDRHAGRQVRLFERDRMLHIDGAVDVATGAPLKAAIDALVGDMMRTTRDDVTAGDGDTHPSVAQLRADALVHLAEHAISCRQGDLPLDTTTVIVRVGLDALRDGVGSAEIDGITQPVSAAAARHLASAAGVIPCVLDSAGEILDWGRRKRFFTVSQRLALVERDGGCAMCNLPPSMTRAHHIRWWARDNGPTDLSNGVLLCESCHHRIHDNGWGIRIHGGTIAGRVWFVPPPAVDPRQTPRLGGRARFDVTDQAPPPEASLSPPVMGPVAPAPAAPRPAAPAPPAPRPPAPAPAVPAPRPAASARPAPTPAAPAPVASAPAASTPIRRLIPTAS